MAAHKEYGLIKRGQKKDATSIQPRLSIFDQDDSDEDGRKGVGKSLQREADKINSRKQVKLDIQSALAVDPTVFEYDTVYDDMVQKKKDEIGLQKRTKVKKSRYIDSLLKAAQSRKLDQERAAERKVQKERLAEGEMFADKEAFVTTAYKKKMQEMQEQEEKDRREAQLEALTDVTKQKDLSGFYRQLYRQTLGTETEPLKTENDESVNVEEAKPTLSASMSENESVKGNRDDKVNPSTSHDIREHVQKVRQFRKRRDSTSSSSEAEDIKEEIHKRRRKSEKSVTSEDEVPVKKNLENHSKTHESKSITKKSLDAPTDDSKNNSSDEDLTNSQEQQRNANKSKGKENKLRDKNKKENREEKKDEANKEVQVSAKDKLLALFRKRTVGEAFDSARQRFLVRREARMVTPVLISENAD